MNKSGHDECVFEERLIHNLVWFPFLVMVLFFFFILPAGKWQNDLEDFQKYNNKNSKDSACAYKKLLERLGWFVYPEVKCISSDCVL